MELKDILSLEDELDFYLVSVGLKPASLIGVNPIPSNNGYITDEGIDEETGVKSVTYRIKDKVRKFILNVLECDNIEYCTWENETDSKYSEESDKLYLINKYIHQQANVATNTENLERLCNATEAIEIGLALGYPDDAVNAFNQVIDGERRNGQYWQISKAKAKQAGLEIPIWLAYISFVPANLDILNGNISGSAEKIGTRYQSYLRENNPDLAKRVEERFRTSRLPDSWEKQPDGSYNVTFNSRPWDTLQYKYVVN